MSSKDIRRFAAGYAVLGLLSLAALFGAYKGLTQQHIASPKTVAHKSDLGDPNVIKQAEANLVQAVQGQGLPVTGTKLISVKQGKTPYEEIVRIKLLTAVGNYVVDVTMTKSVWTLKTFNVVSQSPAQGKGTV